MPFHASSDKNRIRQIAYSIGIELDPPWDKFQNKKRQQAWGPFGISHLMQFHTKKLKNNNAFSKN